MGRIGQDPWIVSGGRHILSRDLIRLLHDRDIWNFAHMADQQGTDIFAQAWKLAHQLDIPPQWHQEWGEFIHALFESHMEIGPSNRHTSTMASGVGRVYSCII